MKNIFILLSLFISTNLFSITYKQSINNSLQTYSPKASAPLGCNYLVYEDFNYAQNIALHNLSGGTGFSDNWQVQNGNTQVPGYQTIDGTGSLSYLDLQTAGRHITGGQSYLASGRRLNTEVNGPMSQYIDPSNLSIGSAKGDQELWISFILQKNQNNDEEVYVELHNDNTPWCNLCQGNLRLGAGYYGSGSNVSGQRRWSLFFNGTIYPTSIPVNQGAPAFLVLKLTFGNTATDIELFVNPTPIAGLPPATPDISIQTTTPFVFKSLAFYGGSQPGEGALDEIRFATTYECVSPDQNTPVDLPPVAIISAMPDSGAAPLLVAFDGSGSINNTSGTLTYLWDFGDGSDISTQEAPNHIYTYPGGVATATLTVTDINGNTSSSTINITVTDSSGVFPCLSSVTSIRQADCSGSNGSFRVNLPGNTSSELTLNGNLITPNANNEYIGLVIGVYQLEVSGSNGCSESYDIYITVDSTTCSGWQAQECAMEIGTNLPGLADWEPHRAFRNFLKNTRGEAIPYTDACGCWSFSDTANDSIFNQMSFDTSGYPTSIPQSTTYGNIKLRYFVSSSGENMPPGHTYLLLYDGNGTIELSGTISSDNYQPGRIQFDLDPDGTFWFQITSSDPSNYIRNIRVVRLEDEFTDLTSEPFYSNFLNKIDPFSVLRFMDWQRTNNNPMINWNERTLPHYFTYGTDQGVPYELIIQLANITKKDIWVCVPHQANDDFIEQMALLFKNNLDPDIVIYLEYSNEVWNWIFDQAHYNNNHRPFNLNYGRAMAIKAKNVFDIWHDVFQSETCRVKRVLGIQAGFNYLNEQILAQLNQDDWDFASPTHYFGLDHDTTGNPVLDTFSTVNDIMTNALNNFLAFKESVKQDYRNVHMMGKEVITYEGGQHFVGNVFGIPYPYQQAMWDAQYSTQMYDMYRMIHDSIRTWGCRLATNFSLAGAQESIYGSWGVLRDIDVAPPYSVTAPKYQALLDIAPDPKCLATNRWNGSVSAEWSNRCNWDRWCIPNENTDVIIDNNYTHAPQVNITTTIHSLKLAQNVLLTILTGQQLNIQN